MEKSKGLIILDPGHGGRYPGVVRNGIKEKDIALEVAKLVKTFVQIRKVYLTRRTDVSSKLRDRVRLANKLRAKCFMPPLMA